jgi:microcystin-dependent protein
VLIQGTPYLALYNNSDAAFYLHGFFGNPYGIPIGASVDFWGATAPNSSFVLAYGQAVSRTTYATLFSLLGTTYGTGDGSTTFNIPDLRGRVVAGKDDMGGSAAGLLSNSFMTGPTTLGGSGGSESRQLATENLPPYTPSGTISGGQLSVFWGKNGFNSPGSVDGVTTIGNSGVGSAALNGFSGFSFAGSAQGGTSAAFGILQPTIIANKLLRII